MKKIYLLNVLLLLTFVLKGQVTIGSKIQALPGALLDLKEKESTDGGENSTKGLLLPRVNLTADATLSDVGITSDLDLYPGLMVYNVNTAQCGFIVPGVYIWDGAIWNRLPATSFDQFTTTNTGLNQPNSYIVNGQAIVEIPVSKAFKIWDGASLTNDAGNPVLASATLNSLTAETLWDDANLICSITLVSNSTLENSIIRVVTNDVKGNAVVSLKNSGSVVWSWHIWSTDNINTITANGNTWMDRNLGATTATIGDVNSKGMLYQWGRKDPFPTNPLWSSDTNYPTLTKGSITTVSIPATAILSMTTSIQNPSAIITGASSPYYDWYVDGNTWNNRWGANGTKSAMDPCPEGWKLPIEASDVSPWTGIAISTDYAVNNGWNFTSFGYYPAAGSIMSTTGAYSGASTGGYYWTGSAALGFPHNMYFNSSAVSTNSQSYAGEGMSVRCIKE